MNKPEAATVTCLPHARIMKYQPQSLEEAEEILSLIFNTPYYALKPSDEQAALLAHLRQNGCPPPETFTVFVISHNGTRVDFELKCLLLMGMIRRAHMEGDLSDDDVIPFVRGVADLYLEFGLHENAHGENHFPGTVRVKQPLR